MAESISFAEINGAACRYALAGQGRQTLVLIHELGGSLNSWDAMLPLLPATLRVLRYDLRGAGMSEKARGTNSIDALADDLAALLDHAGVDGPVIVMAAAMGAAVAVRFASRHTDRVARMVLIGPALGVPAERREAARQLTDRIDREGMRAIADAVLPKAFPDDLWNSPEEKSLAIARWLGADPEGYAANYRILVDNDLRPELAGVTCPVLVLAGRFDPFSGPEAVDAGTAALPDRRFQAVDGGHFMTIQSPGLVANAARAFLEDQ